MPVEQLADKIVIDTNNYMPWCDDHYPVIDSGEKTVHELRQEQLNGPPFIVKRSSGCLASLAETIMFAVPASDVQRQAVAGRYRDAGGQDLDLQHIKRLVRMATAAVAVAGPVCPPY
ncbi:hypothetical protein [Bradyrhizobium sp. dw_78]|uniref:hypothetical protein n=1 Tax=Bradyrhizobium sp. dw_78 TaxID=2719793 RepID=UPI001BD565E2|nr:hypothetical protein [Bradyrhizobium sp. dw_78]